MESGASVKNRPGVILPVYQMAIEFVHHVYVVRRAFGLIPLFATPSGYDRRVGLSPIGPHLGALRDQGSSWPPQAPVH